MDLELVFVLMGLICLIGVASTSEKPKERNLLPSEVLKNNIVCKDCGGRFDHHEQFHSLYLIWYCSCGNRIVIDHKGKIMEK